MPNGRSFTRNWTELLLQELKSFFLNFPSEIWLLSTLLIEVSSVPEEFLTKILTDLLRLLEAPSRPPLLPTSEKMFLELAESSKKSSSVAADTTFSLNALVLSQSLSCSEEEPNSTLRRPRDLLMTLS